MNINITEPDSTKISDLLLSTLLESNSDPVFSVDKNYRYTSFNSSHIKFMKEIYNTNVEPGVQLSDCITHTEDWELAKSNIDKALAGEKIVDEYYAGKLKRMYFRIYHNPVFDNNGSISGVLIVANNLTKWKESETVLVLNEKRLDSLLKISNYNYNDIQELLDFVLSEIIELTQSKSGFLFLHDERKKDFSLRSWSKNILKESSKPNPSFADYFYNSGLWHEINKTKNPILINEFKTEHISRYGMPDNHRLFSKFLGIPVFVENKLIAIAGIADKSTDYTQSDVRQLNLMLDAVWKIIYRKHTVDLITLKDNFNRQVLNNVLDGYVVLNRDLCFIEVNSALCEMLGYTSDELLKMSVYDFDIQTNEIQEHRNNVSTKGSDFFETQYKCKNGEIIDVEISVINLSESHFNFAFIRDITQRKKVESRLIESEKKYRMLAENTKDVIWTMNIQGQFTFMSGSIMDLRGFTVEEAMSQSLDEVLTAESFEMAMPIFNNAIANVLQGIDFPAIHIELEQNCKDGSTVWTDVTANIILDNEGKFQSILGVSRNIHDRKKAEEALIENEEKLSAMFKSMSEMVVIHKLEFNEEGKPVDYTLLDCNDAFTEITGIQKSDAVNKLATEVYQTDVPPYFNEYVSVCFSGLNMEIETFYPPLDKYFMISAISLGKKEMFATITTDITEMKLAQDNIMKISKHYQSLIENAPDGILLANIEGDIVYASPTARKILGYKPEEKLFDPIDEIHPNDLEKIISEVRKTFIDPEYIPTLQYKSKLKSGEWVWIESTFKNLIEDTNVNAIVVNFSNITERKKAEEDLLNSEQNYRLLFADNPQPMMIYDLDTLKYIEVNEAAIQLYGYSSEEFLSMTIEDIHPNEDLARLLDQIDRIRKDLSAIPDIEYRHKKKNGEIIYVQMSSHSITMNGHKARHVLVKDVTERKIAEFELRQKMDELIRFQRLTVDREISMIELKKEINMLLEQSGKEKKYKIVQ